MRILLIKYLCTCAKLLMETVQWKRNKMKQKIKVTWCMKVVNKIQFVNYFNNGSTIQLNMWYIKRTAQSKMIICWKCNHPQVIQYVVDLVSLSEQNKKTTTDFHLRNGYCVLNRNNGLKLKCLNDGFVSDKQTRRLSLHKTVFVMSITCGSLWCF